MSEARRYAAVIVDYGGVLTSSVRDAFGSFASEADLDFRVVGAVLREWLAADAVDNAMHRLERGEIEPAQFEAEFAARLTTRSGQPVEPTGLLGRMFAGSAELPELVAVLHTVKASGRKIGLLSNSWGNEYPTHLWGDLFDDMVISGEVGLRKPDAAIFQLAADRLGVTPPECVFIDDAKVNVDGAVATGMTAILHTDAEATVAELEALLDLPLGAG